MLFKRLLNNLLSFTYKDKKMANKYELISELEKQADYEEEEYEEEQGEVAFEENPSAEITESENIDSESVKSDKADKDNTDTLEPPPELIPF